LESDSERVHTSPLQDIVDYGKDRYAVKSKNHLIPVSPGNNIKFVAVGDINLVRKVNDTVTGHHNDFTFPFHKIKPFLDVADIKYGNLESGITESNVTKKPVHDCATWPSGCCDLHCHFKTSPKVLAGIVEYAGFNMLSIENNHIEDYQHGRKDTQKALDDYNIPWIDESHPYQIRNFKGCNIIFLGYDITFGSTLTYKMKKIAMISNLRAAAPDTFKVMCVHGGIEYSETYTEEQQVFAEAAIDNGADIVIYSHAHVSLPFLMYKGKYIFYGLGNFVFDQHQNMRVRQNLIVTFELENCKTVTNMDVWNGLINDRFQPEIESVNMTTKEHGQSLLVTASLDGNQ